MVPKARSQQFVADPGTARSLMFIRNPTSPATAPEPLFYSMNGYVRYFRDGNKTGIITSFFLKMHKATALLRFLLEWATVWKLLPDFGCKDGTKELGSTSPEHWEVPPSAGIKMTKLEREHLSPRDMSRGQILGSWQQRGQWRGDSGQSKGALLMYLQRVWHANLPSTQTS